MEANYKHIIEKSILEFVNRTHDGIGFHSLNVLSVCNQKVDSIAIKYLSCHEEFGDLIAMDATVSADIITMGLGANSYEADRKTKWFIVHMHGELIKGLHDVGVYRVEEYFKTEFIKEGALDEYMIPYIYTDDLEEEAEMFFEKYCEDAIYNMWQLPYGHIMKQMKIQALEAPLPDNVFGRMYFKPATEKYYYKFYPTLPEKLVEEEIPAGTMLINKQHYFMGSIGSTLNTIAHELVHWDKHQKFFEILALLDEDCDMLSCEVMPQISCANLTGLKKALWWAEWQANTLAPRILMPRSLFLEVLQQIYDDNFTPVFYSGQRLEEALEKTAEAFGVSRFAAKVRAIQLGIMEAEGTMLYNDREYYYPITYRRSALKKNQTFVIDRKSYEKLVSTNDKFAVQIKDGTFVYVECFVCINDPFYVTEDKKDQGKLMLTEYARENAHECCLIFEKHFESNDTFDCEFYSLCYLSKQLNADVLVSKTLTDDLSNQNLEERAAQGKKLLAEGNGIMAIMRDLPGSFSGTFDKHMKMAKKPDGKKMTNIEMSIRTGLSEDYIARIRKEEMNLTIETVCALCIGLHLMPCFSKDLIRKSRTGFPMTDVGFFEETLLEEMWREPLSSINEVLTEQGLTPWGKV